MKLENLDWIIIMLFFGITLFIGIAASRKAGKNTKEFFLSGRNMPWWLLGISMVATTFSADTPNLVTDIVRKNGVAGNWVWWAFLLTGMTTVFIYAKLWRRSGITTDLEFYELRYSGPESTFLRAFRAVYLGVFFNVIVMATVLLAGIKIAGIMLGLLPITTVLMVSLITVVYSSLGGLRGIILTDFFQFILSMIGMIAAAIFIINLPEIGSVQNLIQHPNVVDKIELIPDFNNLDVLIPLLIIPLAVQWWSVWYPGAEPGGGGYIAQRMLSAKNESGAIKATLLFNLAHYALRPWPWILIALASLVLYPDLASIQVDFPSIEQDILKDDLAFSAMLTRLPSGLSGLVLAALIAALMSTISTHLNWGASYMVHDFYKRFIKVEASEKEQVMVGRFATVILMILAGIMSLQLSSAKQAFDLLLQFTAGTGLFFMLRWFWWRINAYSELSALASSSIIALIMEFGVKDAMLGYQKLLIGVVLTTIIWIITTLLTRTTDEDVLKRFFRLIRPHATGWKPIEQALLADGIVVIKDKRSIASEILMLFLGCVLVYMLLFCIGYVLYGRLAWAAVFFIVALASAVFIYKLWGTDQSVAALE